VIVARTGRAECAGLDELLASWDGALTVLWRKRISRHIDRCGSCGDTKRRRVTAAAVLAALPPVIGLPIGLRERVLGAATNPQLIAYRTQLADRAGRFDGDGFPRSAALARSARLAAPRRRAVPVSATAVTVAGAVVFLVLHVTAAPASTRALRQVGSADATSPSVGGTGSAGSGTTAARAAAGVSRAPGGGVPQPVSGGGVPQPVSGGGAGSVSGRGAGSVSGGGRQPTLGAGSVGSSRPSTPGGGPSTGGGRSTASGGPSRKATVPVLLNQPLQRAEVAIRAAGFAVGAVSTRTVAAPAQIGVVVTQRPNGGASALPGTAVALTVGAAAAVPRVAVPAVTGLIEAAAETLLRGAGFTVGTVTSASFAPGQAVVVVAQNPSAGFLAAAGSAVDLTLGGRALS
jgi:PASTA domain